MEETKQLAKFVSELTYEDLPKNVIDKAKELILDQLGCQLAGSTLPWSKPAFEYVVDYKGERKRRHCSQLWFQDVSARCCFCERYFWPRIFGR